MPPPAKNFLTPSQVTERWQALKESELSHVRQIILIIRRQNDGKPQHEIAKFLGFGREISGSSEPSPNSERLFAQNSCILVYARRPR